MPVNLVDEYIFNSTFKEARSYGSLHLFSFIFRNVVVLVDFYEAEIDNVILRDERIFSKKFTEDVLEFLPYVKKKIKEYLEENDKTE